MRLCDHCGEEVDVDDEAAWLTVGDEFLCTMCVEDLPEDEKPEDEDG